MTAHEEFADALRSLRCVVSGEHPMLDGQKHRITVEGEKHSEHSGSGFYVAHLDGHPAGHIRNNKTGEAMDWEYKAMRLTRPKRPGCRPKRPSACRNARLPRPSNRKRRRAASRARWPACCRWRSRRRTWCRKACCQHPAFLPTREARPATFPPPTPTASNGACSTSARTAASASRAPALVIAEGYATAASLSRSLGFATVAAFDSGNLPLVAKSLNGRFPSKPVIIAGDNDQHLEAEQGVNPGKVKAQEAARLTGGRVLLPIFAPGEQAADPKGCTDFNDLACKSRLGWQGPGRGDSVRAAFIAAGGKVRKP